MKKSLTHFLLALFCIPAGGIFAQVTDTLALQDFETSPQSPVWTYTGTPSYFISGYSSASATPANSPVGIGGSRAWQVYAVSGGNPLTFANQTIPSGYDSIRVRFRLAGMNLNGSSGGPDNLDYVLLEYSTNGGTTFYGRIRVRGAVNNNCSWPYSAATIAKAYYQPTTEVVFQPTNSGLQLTEGVGTVELVFPGSVTQVMVRITPRSSSSSDHWLVDNLVLIGESSCTPTTGSITTTACDSYMAPSGQVFTSSGTFQDTISNSGGCDSVITLNLTVNQSTMDSIAPNACDSYTSPGGNTWTSSGTYVDTLQNASGCDSMITIQLTVNTTQYDTLSDTTCFEYVSPSGNYVWTNSGTYLDTLATSAGCDSILTLNVTVNSVDTSVSMSTGSFGLMANQPGATYQWLDCNLGYAVLPGETNQVLSVPQTGSYAVAVTVNGCTDTSNCHFVVIEALENEWLAEQIKSWPNPATDEFHIGLPKIYREVEIELMDVNGKMLSKHVFGHVSECMIPVSELVSGVYFVRIKADGMAGTVKFVK